MELWIRSQEKTVLRPQPKLELDEVEGLFYIVDRYDFEKAIILGTYKTRERALEVLDEIQTHLLKMGKTEMLTNEYGIINGIKDYGIVYEMPKE